MIFLCSWLERMVWLKWKCLGKIFASASKDKFAYLLKKEQIEIVPPSPAFEIEFLAEFVAQLKRSTLPGSFGFSFFMGCPQKRSKCAWLAAS